MFVSFDLSDFQGHFESIEGHILDSLSDAFFPRSFLGLFPIW